MQIMRTMRTRTHSLQIMVCRSCAHAHGMQIMEAVLHEELETWAVLVARQAWHDAEDMLKVAARDMDQEHASLLVDAQVRTPTLCA